MKFSVLMSIYHKEKPKYLDKCMHSIWTKQTIKPNEIVLVEDGKLTQDLYVIINNWRKEIGEKFKIITLEKNVGLGNALNIGIQNCNYELIARMDTDDIAIKNRFEQQLQIFNKGNIDICSGWISEFDNNEKHTISFRKLPEKHINIINFAKKRCPINHPAVMYKKISVQNAGSYKDMPFFEDYYLWARMILAGARFYNIQRTLVNMRTGNGQIQRRSGIKYALNDIDLQKQLLKLNFINYIEFIRNVIIRLVVRIMPKFLIKLMYKIFR